MCLVCFQESLHVDYEENNIMQKIYNKSCEYSSGGKRKNVFCKV